MLLGQLAALTRAHIDASVRGLGNVGRTLSTELRLQSLGLSTLLFGQLRSSLLSRGSFFRRRHFLRRCYLFCWCDLARFNAIKECTLLVSRLSPCRLGFCFLFGAFCLLVGTPQPLPFVIELGLPLGLLLGQGVAQVVNTQRRRFISCGIKLFLGGAFLLQLSHAGLSLVVLRLGFPYATLLQALAHAAY